MEIWERQGGRCAISGKKMEHVFGSPYTVSVDRIDSNIGYKKGNLQLVCQSVNYAKNSFTNEEFLYFWNNDSLSKENSNHHQEPPLSSQSSPCNDHELQDAETVHKSDEPLLQN